MIALCHPLSPALPLGGLPAEKIQAWHQDRLAVVYVRQSTPQQVLDHQESTRLQYGLAQQAQALGWTPARILVIDDDLGKSGTSASVFSVKSDGRWRQLGWPVLPDD